MAVTVPDISFPIKGWKYEAKAFSFQVCVFYLGKKVFLKRPSQISPYISLECTGSQAWEAQQRGMGLAVPG